MDNQKDSGAGGRGLQNKPVNEALSVFEKDRLFSFLFKKTEKISAAVYLVSDLFSEDEPLRMRLREFCLCLLSKFSALMEAQNDEKSAVARAVLTALAELDSQLGIAHMAGLVSVMNFNILNKEICSLGEVVEVEFSNEKIPGRMSFSASFFDIGQYAYSGQDPASARFSHNFSPAVYKGHKITKDIKDKVSNKIARKADAAPHPPRQQSDKKGRQEEIVAIFQRDSGKALTIKDISVVIKDCSEKTIQRQLLDMVANGVLKKEGERRWSRYSIR